MWGSWLRCYFVMPRMAIVAAIATKSRQLFSLQSSVFGCRPWPLAEWSASALSASVHQRASAANVPWGTTVGGIARFCRTATRLLVRLLFRAGAREDDDDDDDNDGHCVRLPSCFAAHLPSPSSDVGAGLAPPHLRGTLLFAVQFAYGIFLCRCRLVRKCSFGQPTMPLNSGLFCKPWIRTYWHWLRSSIGSSTEGKWCHRELLLGSTSSGWILSRRSG